MSKTSKTTEAQTKKSSLAVIVSILVVVGSLFVFYLDPLGLNTLLYKVLVLLAGLILAGFIFFKSSEGIRFNVFLRETKIELRKVVWPTRNETIKTTVMIMIAVIIVAIFLALIDSFFVWLVQLITS